MDSRLDDLRGKLKSQQVIVTRLGLDVERPLKSIDAGFPENAVTLVGKLIERILKESWDYYEVIGKPEGKGLNELIKGVKEHINSPGVLQALADIQQLRNRSAHDGYLVEEQDALVAIARFAVVLEWLQATRHDLTGTADIVPDEELVARIEFVSGLYDALGYRLLLRQDLTSSTTYLQFGIQAGSHADYVEIVLGQSYLELCQIFEETHGELLRTGYPKLTRFVLVDDELEEESPGSPLSPARIVGYQQFLDTVVDSKELSRLAAEQAALRHHGSEIDRLPLIGDVLTIDRRTLEYAIRRVPDVESLVRRQEADGGNLLIVGPGGMGKSDMLLRLAMEPALGGRYRFYLDLGDRRDGESFPELVVRQLGAAFAIPRLQVWDCFLYLVRSGRCVCLLDAIDEGVPGGGIDAVVDLFGQLSVLLSRSSATVLTSRQSFLLDSPYVRQLLHRDALVSEKVSSRLVSEGVDVLSLPDFSCVRLTGVADRPGVSPLMRLLADRTGLDGDALFPLVEDFVGRAAREAGATTHDLADAIGAGCLRGESMVSVFDLFRSLGPDAFMDGIPEADQCRLLDLMAPVSRGELRFRHQVFREYLAAHHYHRHPESAELAGVAVTDQCRDFVRALAVGSEPGPGVVAGTYLVGPPGQLRIHAQPIPVHIARRLVTAGEYAAFLRAVDGDDPATYQHPLQPTCATVLPFYERLQIPSLYDDPRFAEHPATCVSWWGAWSYAHWAGGRLPTSTEWELAARGRDGRLFPWGDEADPSRLNCADHWSLRLFPSWDEWRAAYDRGDLASGEPTAVGSFPAGTSPSGCLDMAGNVWEWTASCLETVPDAVIAGGSFDNPIRGTRTFSRGAYRLNGRSNAVGFRILLPQETGA